MKQYEIIAGRLEVSEAGQPDDNGNATAARWSLDLQQAFKQLADFPDMPEAIRLQVESAHA